MAQPLILDISAEVILADVNRRMRLPLGIRVGPVAAERRDHRALGDVGVALHRAPGDHVDV